MPPRYDRTLALAVGSRVRALRGLKGWSQEDLAAKAGVQPETVSRVETGRGAPSLPMLGALSSALGCQPGDLLGTSATDGLVPLTADELTLLAGWRRLAPSARRLVSEIVQEWFTK